METRILPNRGGSYCTRLYASDGVLCDDSRDSATFTSLKDVVHGLNGLPGWFARKW